MKRGIVTVSFIVFLFALFLVGFSFLDSTLFREIYLYKEDVTETLITTATNAMEFLKKSLQQSLTYSYYQASYDISRNGGSLNSLQTWRTYENTFDIAIFSQTLEKRILELFKKYISALAERNLNIPDYSRIKFAKLDNVENITAISNGDLKIVAGISTLTDGGNLFVYIPTKTLTLLSIGEENFIANDKAKEKIELGVSDAISDASLPPSGSASGCNHEPSPEDVFKRASGKSFAEAENFISEKVGERLLEIETELSTDKIPIKLPTDDTQIVSEVDPQCSEPRITGNCGCCSSSCTGPCLPLWTRTCNFDYYSSSKVKIQITDSENKYPIYDAADNRVDMRNIQLNFTVISSNNYDEKLIQE